ncbi:MAG: HD domain-containing protein [Planctomycetota bacterium]|jgi:exopolyphosphatase/guanosine-5'-triphosphate,3'-diphosphate pyrophosphatase|nr:HD domain-containing protein [Planctomycetota bacterium]
MEAKKTGGGRRGRASPARQAAAPTLLAGIDLGSTAVRLNIAETGPDAGVRVIEELTHPVSTGADIFRHGRILPGTMTAILHIIGNYLRLADDYGVEHRQIAASSAIHEAANREILADRVRHDTGLALVLLDTVEESRLAYQALLPWLRRRQGNFSLALNIGGGSTEMMILRGEDLQIGGVRRLGVARLFHAAGQTGGQTRAEILRAMSINIVNSARDVYQEYNISTFFLVNRNLYRAFRNDPLAERRPDDFIIAAEPLRRSLEKAYQLSPTEIGRLFNLGLTDAEMLIPAMLILDSFVWAVETAEVTFTNTETLSGLLIEMGMALRGENPLTAFRRQMVRSARAVGERYGYDRAHARMVTEFSLAIFDAVREMLDLDDRDRLLLELSAVLHDIGMYVSENLHHRHSAYLIKWSDIVGINENARALIAQTAYFHRQETPSDAHPDYMALSQFDRIRVAKLAGILRLADVLDRGHRQNVRSLKAEIAGEELRLVLDMSGDMGIITEALPKKADLIELVTGLRPVLRRNHP